MSTSEKKKIRKLLKETPANRKCVSVTINNIKIKLQ